MFDLLLVGFARLPFKQVVYFIEVVKFTAIMLLILLYKPLLSRASTMTSPFSFPILAIFLLFFFYYVWLKISFYYFSQGNFFLLHFIISALIFIISSLFFWSLLFTLLLFVAVEGGSRNCWLSIFLFSSRDVQCYKFPLSITLLALQTLKHCAFLFIQFKILLISLWTSFLIHGLFISVS